MATNVAILGIIASDYALLVVLSTLGMHSCMCQVKYVANNYGFLDYDTIRMDLEDSYQLVLPFTRKSNASTTRVRRKVAYFLNLVHVLIWYRQLSV